MFSFADLWNRLIQPYAPIEDEAQLRDATVLASVALGILLVSIFGTIISIGYYTIDEALQILPVLFGMLLFLIPYHFSRRGDINRAADMLAGIAFLLITTAVLRLPSNINFEILYYYVSISIFVSLYIRTISKGIYYALCLIAIIAFGLLNRETMLSSVLRGPLSFYIFTSSFAVLFIHLAHQREMQKQAQLQESERKRASLQVKQEQYAVLSLFARAITHDFRTRLQGIEFNRYLVTRLLEKGADPSAIEAKLESIDTYVKRISSELSRLDVLINLEKTIPEQIYPDKLIQELQPQLIHRALSNQQVLELDLNCDDVAILNHPTYFQTVLEELLRNARTHTLGSQAIIIKTQYAKDSLEVHVIDSGKGIDPEHLDNLFGAFYKTDAARTTNHGGLGLGLSIVKTTVEAFDGTVSISSEVGSGTDVKITFPIVK